jgi:hypothetical protein
MSDELEPAKPDSGVHAASSKVTIAFPFSNIQMREPSEETKELAAIVVKLTQQLAALQPSPDADALVAQATKLLTKLT